MPRILIVDDDPEVRETMASLIRRQKLDYDAVSDLATTRRLLGEQAYDVVLLDVRLPDGNGLDLLPEIRELPLPPEVVILTGQGDPDGAELAIQGGVWDYLVKPAPIRQISLTLHRALAYHAEKAGKCDARALDLGGIVGSSKAMRACFDVVAQAASSDANVLITGETGSGKELFARTIHANSRRARGPFVVVDCAALTDTLVESTLFGHKKGAFTGAVGDREGLVSLAHKGVLFLDEVGELPLSIQKSLLRVLQERRFRPVGETRERESDFRLLSATNRDLEAMVADGRFRSDLLYRIKTLHLHLPPLRERGEDVKALALARADVLCARYGIPAKGFDADFFDVLAAYHWPGNVRELHNVLELAITAAGPDKTLYAMHLPMELRIKVAKAQLQAAGGGALELATPTLLPEREQGPEERDLPLPALARGREGFPQLKDYKDRAERQYLLRLTELSGGEVQSMLALSGLSRSHLYALLKKHGLSGQ